MIYYKALRCFLCAGLLAGLLASCTTKTSTDNEPTQSSEVPVQSPSATDEINSNQTELLTTIIGSSNEGVIRGISFGDPVSKVKATEAFEMFEDSLRHVGYTFETEQLETIDVLYYFAPTERTVNKITVDVYLNSAPATRQLWESARKRFTDNYGTALESEGKRIGWKNSRVKATMVEVSEGKDFGLKFVFEPADKSLLASK